jgi:predicted N-acetyltransferase YhbS
MAFVYRVATEADRDQYIDFANLVFSMAHRPHDFKAMLPKVYGDGKKTAHMQNLALDDAGNIRGLVAVMPNEMTVMGEVIRTGYLGTVSVHPYARGEGHMKKLMGMALDGMRADGCDLTMLGGQRQRYEYFGYTRGGVTYVYTASPTNARHALSGADAGDIEIREVHADDSEAIAAACALHAKKPCRSARTPENFHDIASSWMARLMGIYKAGAFSGYMIVGWNGEVIPITEFVLADDALAGAVVKKYLEQTGSKGCEIECAEFDIGIRRALSRFCEYSSVREGEQLAIFNFPKVIGAFMKLKASYAPLEDGVRGFVIDGQPLTISVHANQVSVIPEAPNDAPSLSAMDAQFLFFGRDGALYGKPLPMGWGQLPLYLDSADHF